MTRRWTLEGDPSSDDLRDLADVLCAGGVALLPTDTIYGLHALADHQSAILRIASMKDRDDTKPFLVLGSSIDQLEKAGAAAPHRIRPILEELWPGPLTAIVPLTMPIAASRGASSIGVRVPDLAWLRALLDRTGPLASTSANRSGEAPITTPESLSHDLQRELDALVDAGLRDGKASVVVDFTGDEPRFIRDGERLFTQKVWKTLRKSL
jgi:L-threonylcarbamoyladenylate synthase